MVMFYTATWLACLIKSNVNASVDASLGGCRTVPHYLQGNWLRVNTHPTRCETVMKHFYEYPAGKDIGLVSAHLPQCALKACRWWVGTPSSVLLWVKEHTSHFSNSASITFSKTFVFIGIFCIPGSNDVQSHQTICTPLIGWLICEVTEWINIPVDQSVSNR